jgi:hypothetical protein
MNKNIHHPQCCILYNERNLVIVCIHGTPSGMSPWGLPMVFLEHSNDAGEIGSKVLECLGQSRFRIDEDVVHAETKQIFKLTGSKNLRMLTKNWELVNIYQDGNNIDVRKAVKDKLGWSFVKEGYTSAIDVVDVGNAVNYIILSQPVDK